MLLLPGTLLPGNPVSSLPQFLQVSAQMSPFQGGASLTVLCKRHSFPLRDLLSWRLHHLPLCIRHLLSLLSDSLTGKWVLEGDAVGMGSPPLLRAGISDLELGT